MIDLSRRALIGSILAGTLIGVVPSSALLASLPDRYRELIEAQKRVIVLQEQFNIMARGWTVGSVSSTSQDQIANDIGLTTAVDYLLTVLLDRFPERPSNDEAFAVTHSKIKDVIENRLTINTLSSEELRQHEDAIVTVSVLRRMMATYGMRVDGAANGAVGKNWLRMVNTIKVFMKA